MNSAVLLSINPKWDNLIATDKKTFELRKTKPKIQPPFICYRYCTKSGNCLITDDIGTTIDYIIKNGGMVTGEFVCDSIYEITEPYLTWLECCSCVRMNDIAKYMGEKEMIYAWHILKNKTYDKPIKLSEFGLKRPPQSWCYVEENKNES